jgi:hypothetical protein
MQLHSRGCYFSLSCPCAFGLAGEVLLGDLSRSGFDITLDEDETTDAIVINTVINSTKTKLWFHFAFVV